MNAMQLFVHLNKLNEFHIISINSNKFKWCSNTLLQIPIGLNNCQQVVDKCQSVLIDVYELSITPTGFKWFFNEFNWILLSSLHCIKEPLCT